MDRLDEELVNLTILDGFDEHHLKCLLNPEKAAPVWRLSDCECTEDEKKNCRDVCFFNAISHREDGNVEISGDKCTGCAACIDNCKLQNLMDRKDLIPIFELLKGTDPVYALIAPAFTSQFSEDVTPGKLRSAFKLLGFAGMIEVALFADILTLKEALEFDRLVREDKDFMLTSCCCPIWIAMIRRIYNQLMPRLPPSVSPMVASGRAVKKMYPKSKTVFIGPCIAKKSEAKDKDVNDAVDYVLTFEEIRDIFDAAGIRPADLPDDRREHSSTAGRIYARTGGVSKAVESTLKRLKPNRAVPFNAVQANGTLECKKLLAEIKNGEINANFIEGMGCPGGCVGGPKVLIDKEKGAYHVAKYGEKAAYRTPAENPYVIELLNRLGFLSAESLLENGHMFNRDFSNERQIEYVLQKMPNAQENLS